ncbi:hypothetical protein IT568_05045 [bacterium]|nr:hypothetical protein [bacterium]
MEEMDLFDYYESMVAKNILLAFKGTISQNILVGLGEMIKDKLMFDTRHYVVSKKVFSIFIELAQNIFYYSAEKINLGNTKAGSGILVIKECEKFYTISSGNKIENSKATEIVQNCEFINQLDKNKLKEFYKEKLNTPKELSQNGGGVGLIDIARKSGNKLNTKIIKINENYSFFVLSVNIIKEN